MNKLDFDVLFNKTVHTAKGPVIVGGNWENPILICHGHPQSNTNRLDFGLAYIEVCRVIGRKDYVKIQYEGVKALRPNLFIHQKDAHTPAEKLRASLIELYFKNGDTAEEKLDSLHLKIKEHFQALCAETPDKKEDHKKIMEAYQTKRYVTAMSATKALEKNSPVKTVSAPSTEHTKSTKPVQAAPPPSKPDRNAYNPHKSGPMKTISAPASHRKQPLIQQHAPQIKAEFNPQPKQDPTFKALATSRTTILNLIPTVMDVLLEIFAAEPEDRGAQFDRLMPHLEKMVEFNPENPAQNLFIHQLAEALDDDAGTFDDEGKFNILIEILENAKKLFAPNAAPEGPKL